MIISSNGTDYKPIPAGTYAAICTRVIDLGTQTSNWQGQEKAQRKVLLTWEVPEVEIEFDGEKRPATISSSYTASLHEKAALRGVLKSWRGRDFTADELQGFDLKNVLGAPCMIGIVHNDKNGNTYANVEAVMALPKGMPKPAPHGELLNIDLDEFDRDEFNKLSDRLKEKITGTPEYRAIMGEVPASVGGDYAGDFRADLDDEIPF
jgi:hypothetical protein